MQRTQTTVTLTLAAAAFACAFTTPAHAQSKPYYVGYGTALRQAAERFDLALGALELKERNGGLIDISDFAKLDKIVFPAGWGMNSAGVGETGSCGGGIEDEVRRRLRARTVELADKPIPVRYEDLHAVKVVILDAQVDVALRSLADSTSTSSILPFPTSVAGEAFADMVRFHVDPADERQALDAENLIAEFTKTLEGEVQQMRGRKRAGLEATWLILTEFRMNVERTRARRAIEAGASPAPAMTHFASLFLRRERLAKGVGIAN